mmetsp:Transcript_36925/g.82516  ORF Transcript_36925/g.82516 Transcript_36925/m.82516 type:complete len:467 (+) Transcript_36925:70-1470(+)
MTNGSELKWRNEVEASFSKAWPVFLTVLIYNIVFTLKHMLMDPVLRSFVHCTEPGEGEIFSGSSFCKDKKYVVQVAVRQSAMLSATEGILSMFVVPVIGAVSDRHGRLPALRACILATFLHLLINLASQDVLALRFLAFACSSVCAAFFPTFHAILGDCGGNRSVSFTVKIIFANAGQLVGWIIGVVILRQEYVDYTFMWTSLIAIFSLGSVVACRIQESRPTGSGQLSSPNVFAALYFALQNPFLLRWCVAKFLALFSLSVMHLLKSFVLSAYDWRQGTLEGVMGAFFFISAASTLAGPWFVHRYSVETVVERCTLMGAISLSILIFAPLGSFFCATAAFMQAAAACTIAASSALLAERFTEDQGKAQSVVVALAGGASNLGIFLFSRLYDAKAEGAAQAEPFAVAMVVGWAAYYTLLSALAHPSPTKHSTSHTELKPIHPDDPKGVVMGRRHSFDRPPEEGGLL